MAEGIPEDLHEHLFDPFVTTKANGTGLGLALVAKIVGDHGGFIGFRVRGPADGVQRYRCRSWTGATWSRPAQRPAF